MEELAKFMSWKELTQQRYVFRFFPELVKGMTEEEIKRRLDEVDRSADDTRRTSKPHSGMS